MEQIQYDPRVNVDIGQPLEAPDIEQQIGAVAQQQAQLDQQFLDQMGSNQKMDTQNLQTTIKNEQAALAQSQRQMEQLGQFSDMIMKQAKAFGEDYMKDRAAEGQAARLDMDPSTFSPEAIEHYNRTLAELKLAKEDSDEAAAQALRSTQNYEVAQRYQSLGQYQRVGFAKQHMQEKKIEWPSRLQDAMNNDNTTQITRPDGTTFTPQQAMQSGNSAERAAAASVLYKGFIKDAGMSQSNPLFVEQYFAGGDGGARQQTQKFLADANKASNINKSQKGFYNATVEFGIDKDFGDLWRASGLLLDKNGKPLTFEKRWEKITAVAEAGIKSGQITNVEQFLQNTVDPLTNKPLSTRTGFANKLRAAADSALTTNYNRIENRKKVLYQQTEIDFLKDARAQGDGLTYGEYQAMQKQLRSITGQESVELAEVYKNTKQNQNRESNLKVLQSAAANGTLTTKMITEAGFGNSTDPVIMDLRNKAQSIQNIKTSSNDFKAERTAIQQSVRQIANLSKDAPLGIEQLAVTNKLLADVKQKAALLLQDGTVTSPELAATGALNYFMDPRNEDAWVNRGFVKGATEGELAPGVNNNFATYNSKIQATSTSLVQTAAAAKKKLDEDLKNLGTRAYTTPNAYVTPERLESGAEGYYEADGTTINKNWRPDPLIAQLAAADPNETVLSLTNKLRAANNLEPLKPPESQFLPGDRDETIDSATAQLLQQTTNKLEKARTGYETLRAGMSGGDVATPQLRIPKALEPVFTQVSTNTGLRVELVQALAQAESRMDPDAQSKPNADGSVDNGLFQINSLAHPEYKYRPGDVMENARFAEIQLNRAAAKADELGVLPEYREKFILAGYNQGQNSIPVINGVPQFNAAHRRYISDVYKQMGGLGRREVLRDASTMRKPFASAVDPVYITGNIGPTSTGEHLDVKRLDRGDFAYSALDEFVEVDDKDLGRVPLSRVPQTGTYQEHVARGSHGRDYGTYEGSKLYLKNGAKVVPELSGPTEHGYYMVIEVPDGTRYSFLHGSAPQ